MFVWIDDERPFNGDEDTTHAYPEDVIEIIKSKRDGVFINGGHLLFCILCFIVGFISICYFFIFLLDKLS